MMWLEMHVYPSSEGIGIYFRDITTRKAAETSLQNALQRLNFHVENSPLAVIEWDHEFRVSRWSPEAERIFGWQAEEVIGKNLQDWQFIFTEDLEVVTDTVTRLAEGLRNSNICYNRNYTKDNSIVYCEWYNSTLLDESGKLISVLSLVLDVTERKRMEATLRESEERFREMADASPTLIWMSDTSKVCNYFNKTWLEFTGRTIEQEIGNGWVEGVHPDDLQYCIDIYINAFDAREEFSMEYRLKRYDGEYRWILDNGVPRFTSSGNFLGYIGSCIDISDAYRQATQRKQAEAEREKMLVRVQQYADQLRGLTEAALAINSALSIEEVLKVITERSRFIIGAHQSVTSMTIDNNWAQAINAVSLSDKYAVWRDYKEKPDGSGIYACVCHTNRPIRMTQVELEAHPRWRGFGTEAAKHPPMRGWLAAPLTGRDGSNIGLIQLSDKYDENEFTAEDEAILVQLAQMASVAIENTRLYEAEQLARTQAESANRIKDEFLAVLSHELRTPLNPILGWSKLLRTRKFDETKTAEALATIERNAKLQAQLIEDLLDVSRILRGKLTLNIDKLSPASIILAALETVRLAAEAKSISIQTIFDPNVGQIAGDAGRLQQVIWNLLSNAVKFTPNGGRVEVRLSMEMGNGEWGSGRAGEWGSEGVRDNSFSSSPRSLPIPPSPSSRYAQIIVSDTGKGIALEFLPYVFDYFRQADSATTRKFGGLGLGLAIVRQLVDLHGGSVFAEILGEGQGATFSVKLQLLSKTDSLPIDLTPEDELNS
ncbi:MAG: PAS domain S-box protein, partial [Tolypothrix sp. T3-bin4]|nr:PAS domain S-box protein [Tolypothrix sp. T3-bin4]